METKATDSCAVTSGQTTLSTIDKVNSKHHLSMLREVHPINDRNTDADRHQDILSLALSTVVLTLVTRACACFLSRFDWVFIFFGPPSPPPATPSDDMGIKRTSTLSSTSLTSQPLPTAVWIARKSKKLIGFYPKSPSLVRAISSTICFDPCMIFQPLELFLLLVVLVRRNF
ncbi:hypothetical protein L3X38_035372 [Prunus dulcis]|uniref:Transmembrane protein n=1 Tax=Prunus dulcis TaxID=3755 RepID=A0AAD4VJT1_PRUDU|nr:hypothetical protein L3X38_035372 [Prunus dulcis]